jgi:photosystem II stability/assembly factor-like uncharacterized protein
MTSRIELYVGTAGHSAWFSEDLGQTFVHPNSHSGMYLEARVWGFCSHRAAPDLLYAATDMGLFKWDERTTRWTLLPSPMHDVWAVVQDPDQPHVLYAGTRPAGFFQSMDGGATWRELPAAGVSKFSEVNMGPTRVTQLLFDPLEADTLWATVEIGGIYRSADRGRTWEWRADGLVSADVHGIARITDADGSPVVYATTNRGLHRSRDDGRSWTFQPLDSPWQYTRAIAPRADTDAVLFMTNGDGPPGSTGRLLRSDDHGRNWRDAGLGRVNSTPWCIATHPHDPMLIFVATNLGQLFRSTDGGDSWLRLPHEFGEVRALCWRPVQWQADRPAHSVTVRPAVAYPQGS